MAGALYLDADQASDLRANTAIAQAKDQWYQDTAPDRAVDQARTDYYTQRAADDAIAQARTDYYSQRSQLFGDTLGSSSQTQAAGASVASPSPSATEQASSPSPMSTPVPPAASGPLTPDAPVTASLSQTTLGQRPSQFDLGLSSADAMAFCGPAAAIAFAKTYGRNPTVDEAKQLAVQAGWNPSQGMAGVQSEQKLLASFGVQTKLEQSINWDHVSQDANSGNPVIIDTPGHYFYVTGARQGQNGTEYNVGTSGTDLRRGATWMTADQMGQLMGTPRAALYADHPLAEGPSQAEQTPPTQISGALGGAVQAVKDKAGQVMDAVQNIGNLPLGVSSAAGPASTIGGTASAVGNVLTQPVPGTQNLVGEFSKQSTLEGGDVGYRPTQADQYVTARSMASALAQALVPEDIAARAVTGSAGSLAKSAEAGQALVQGRQRAEGVNPFDMLSDLRKIWSDDQIAQDLKARGVSDEQVQSLLSATEKPAAPIAADAGERAAEPPVPAVSSAAETPVELPSPAAPSPEPTAPAQAPPSSGPNAWDVAQGVLAESKKSIFSLSNVHALNITKGLTMSPAGPQGAAQFAGRYVTALVRGPSDPAVGELAGVAEQAVKDGLNLFAGANPETGAASASLNPILVGAARSVGGAITGAGGGYEVSQRAGASDEDTLRNTIVGGAIGALAGPTVAERIHQALWQDAVPFAKLITYKAAVDGGAAGDQAAMFANNLNGGQNLARTAGSKPIQDIVRFFVQSPDWALSQLKLTGAGVAGTAKTLVGKPLTGNEQLSRDWLLKTALVYGLATEATQFALTGHFTDQNSPGHEFMVEYPSGASSKSGKAENITVPIFDSNLQQVLDAFARTANDPLKGGVETVLGKANRVPLTAAEELANQQYFPSGPEISKPTNKVFGKVKMGDSDQDAARKRALFAAGQFAPIGITGPLSEFYAGAPAPLVAGSTLLGQPMGHNAGQQRTAGGPSMNAPVPLPSPTAPVTVPLRTPTPTRAELIEQRRAVMQQRSAAPTPTR